MSNTPSRNFETATSLPNLAAGAIRGAAMPVPPSETKITPSGPETGLACEIESLRRKVTALEAERAANDTALADLAARRNALAIDSRLNGDAAAREQLVALADDERLHQTTVRDLEAALAAGRQRLDMLERRQEAATLRRQAGEVEAKLVKLDAATAAVDSVLLMLRDALVASDRAIRDAASAASATGRMSPNGDLVAGVVQSLLGRDCARQLGIGPAISPAAREARSFRDAVGQSYAVLRRVIADLKAGADTLER